MQTRPLGPTGQHSSVLTFGAIALNWLEQAGADQLLELLFEHGVNHVDVAPTYGDAELKLGPKLRQHREELFLGCKTQERTYDGAWDRLERSIDRLGVETIDLYQIHGLETERELEAITAEDGPLRAFRDARERGLIEHVGLTSHAQPGLILEAIDRIEDLDTVMFPLNPVVDARDGEQYEYDAVLERAAAADLGTLAIKAFAGEAWPDTDELPEHERPYATWYRPVETSEAIRDRLNYALSRGVNSVVSPGDPKLVAMVLEAAERFEELDAPAMRSLREAARDDESPVPAQLHH